jgi:hypothetical protein
MGADTLAQIGDLATASWIKAFTAPLSANCHKAKAGSRLGHWEQTMSSLDFEHDGQESAELLQRRWFAAVKAVRALQAECALLFEASLLADAAWRRSRDQLADLESITAALERELCALDAPPVERREPMRCAEMSAA